jgi:hypothetical protein
LKVTKLKVQPPPHRPLLHIYSSHVCRANHKRNFLLLHVCIGIVYPELYQLGKAETFAPYLKVCFTNHKRSFVLVARLIGPVYSDRTNLEKPYSFAPHLKHLCLFSPITKGVLFLLHVCRFRFIPSMPTRKGAKSLQLKHTSRVISPRKPSSPKPFCYADLGRDVSLGSSGALLYFPVELDVSIYHTRGILNHTGRCNLDWKYSSSLESFPELG